MKFFTSVWTNYISALVVLACVAFPLSEIIEQFFVASAAGTGAEHDPTFGNLGRAFGFFLLLLFGVGAVLIPGELVGIVRLYRKQPADLNDQKAQARTLLLISVGILSICSIASLIILSMRLAAH